MRVKNKNIRFRDIVKWVIFATNVVVILLLLLSSLAWRVSPLKTNIFSYIGLGFGFILLANICYLFLWLFFSKWKLAIVSLAAILICYNPVSTFFPAHFTSDKAPKDAVKILTYNVQAFINESNKNAKERPILEYIAKTDADIVCLQEYLVSKTGQSIISQRDVNRILNQYPYQSIIGLEASGQYHTYGLACFSKYPIENTHEVVFKSSFNGAAVYTININGKKHTVANVHLESNSITAEDKKLYSDFLQNSDEVKIEDVTTNIRSKLGSAYRARANQVKLIKDYISRQETEGVIICGDFNDTPISYTYGQMKKGLKDAYAGTGFGPGITYHKDFFLFRIDYIMHSPEIKARKTKVEKIKYSDHYPVWTYLDLNIQPSDSLNNQTID